ncbi:MAG: alpha beta-Hydrolase [Lasallia pustulata]|uniref:Alpha beta-Hydrolase n=1 Tax=Lasallia pustulata TaxID=136370 RepID=A0A5M8PVH9_9LECA|nr:MAG: alpha beta-Hydrolase [Lasallia pustulata]
MAETPSTQLPPLNLPTGLTERYITSEASELTYHIIEAGSRRKPLLILLHGFPEIAYSWRKIMPRLGRDYRVVAVDQRGYGRTTGWDYSSFGEVDLGTFSVTNLIRDIVVLVHALGYHQVHCVVGHDFGAVAASLCALARPDFFHRVVLMSHPFKGSSKLPFDVENPKDSTQGSQPDIHQELAALSEPRKHYKWYYSTAPANAEMSPPDGLHEFLRGYFHLKSADWAGNDPHPLQAWSATELAKMPYYYIMPLKAGMRQAVAKDMSHEDHQQVHNSSSRWLPDSELEVYVNEWARTGFQGGLNWYRVQTDPKWLKDADLFAGKTIEVPCLFISGTKDWGIYQEPGVVERMADVCKDFRGVKMIEGAGHWVQQEQPERVVEEILDFLRS